MMITFCFIEYVNTPLIKKDCKICILTNEVFSLTILQYDSAVLGNS